MSKRAEALAEADKLINPLIAAIDAEPHKAENYYDLSCALIILKSYTQAEELLKRALLLFQEQGDLDLLHYGLGNVFYAAQLYPEALAEYQKIETAKWRAEGDAMMAQTYYMMQDYQHALVYGLTALDLRGNNIDALLVVGNCFLSLGDFKNAKQYFDRVLTLEPKNLEANFDLGVIAKLNHEDASRYFNLVQTSDPIYFKKMQERLVNIEKALRVLDDKSAL